MEKITKVYEVYDFEELDEEIQKKLIEEEKRSETEFYLDALLYEDLEEEAKRLINKYFNKNNKIDLKNLYYSFSYCQGDGGGFEFEGYYRNKFFRVVHRDNFYCYYKTFKIIDDYDLTEKEREKLEKKVYTMLDEFEKIGWQLVEYEPDDATAIDFLKEQKYLKNGVVFKKEL